MFGIFIAIYLLAGLAVAIYVLADERTRQETRNGQMWLGMIALWLWPAVLLYALVIHWRSITVHQVSSAEYLRARTRLIEERKKREKWPINQ